MPLLMFNKYFKRIYLEYYYKSFNLLLKMQQIFRYPGGKARAIKFIKPFWENLSHTEYREPFVGGGSVFIAKNNVKRTWINDLDKDLISFFKVIKNCEQREFLIKELLKIKVNRDSYDYFYKSKPIGQIDKAIRFYFLNRCSFSGITKWNAFIGDSRWNINRNQDNIRKIGEKLRPCKITSIDFEKVIAEKSKNSVFLFLDPPYAESRQVAAYNKAFSIEDHERLAIMLKKTNFKFLLTYDNCKYIRDLYKEFNLFDRSWTYSVANSRVHHNPREAGNELFITNYDPIFVTK